MTEIYKLARPKLAGYPLQIINGQLPKEVVNPMLRDILGGLPQFTGEVVVGRPEALDCYEKSKEFAESTELLNLFVFWVYDIKTTELYSLKDRLHIAESFISACGPNTQYVDHQAITSEEDIAEYKAKLVESGFTHMILREPYGTFGTEDEEVPTSAPM